MTRMEFRHRSDEREPSVREQLRQRAALRSRRAIRRQQRFAIAVVSALALLLIGWLTW